MTHRLNRPILLVLLSTFWVGCKTDMGASYAELLRVLQPDSSCLISINNAPTSTGIYDPTVNEGVGYTISYLVKNNLAKAADDVVALSELTNVHGVVNDVRILGFEGCWYINDGSIFTAASDPNGLVDCNKLSSQSGFFVAPQTALEGGDQEVASVTVLTLTDLRNLFGSDFTPELIPDEGNFAALNPASNDPNLQYNISQNTESPADVTTRSIYWGQNYPTNRDVVVNVQLRARAQTQSGTTFHTNWMVYPITISPGGLKNTCGYLVPKVCARGPCSNGAACTTAGTCADGSSCSNAVLPSGESADLGTCLPAQGFSSIPVICNPVGCDATN